MRWRRLSAILFVLVADGLAQPRVQVSRDGRFLQTSDGRPFFWLGDTAWLLSQKLDRDEAERYLEDRRGKGFNVIQCSILHDVTNVNAYGMSALTDGDPARPRVTSGKDHGKTNEYDYWDHVDWLVDTAGSKGMYLAIVPTWGSNVRSGRVNATNVRAYSRFLGERYRNRTNIFWLVGGDTHGDQQADVWSAMGEMLKKVAPHQLITFHPFGRTQSSTWFHAESWLDFNMFQSGHRRYDQDSEAGKGEDTWRYVSEDLRKNPPKPTVDGEPSYEGIPQGLHDPREPVWTDKDARRYAYWSVFAGAFGHTYGHSAIMQMFKPGQAKGAYGNTADWIEALSAPGANQMQHLKKLILSRSYFDRVPDQTLVAGTSERYERVIATRGKDYALLYTHTGRPFQVHMERLPAPRVRATWYDPRTGESRSISTFRSTGMRQFTPPGSPAPGNDWVLVLENAGN